MSYRRPSDIIQRNWLLVLAIIIAIHGIIYTLVYSDQPLLEAHGFRQTQTALTSYWMIQEGWKLAYETPVIGYPWSIPFEFPIYQTIVAFLSSMLNSSLDKTGRTVSFIFLLLCAGPAYLTAKRLKYDTSLSWLFCALLWSSPLYLVWGRTFMIETTAIFFTMMTIPYAIDLTNKNIKISSIFLLSIFASLALLQKITTALPVLFILGVMTLIDHYTKYGLKIPGVKKILYLFLAFGLPVIIALWWVNYTDEVRSLNPFGSQLTSAKLKSWNFGTWEQRIDYSNYVLIFIKRAIKGNIAALLGIVLVITSILKANDLSKRILFMGLSMYVLPIIIFFNLQIVHDYYQASSAIFLIGSVAIAVKEYIPKKVYGKYMILVLSVGLILFNLLFFHIGWGKWAGKDITESNNTVLKISETIKKSTPTNSGIVVFGSSWSSAISYYSKRKSFTVPNNFTNFDDAWESPSKYIGDLNLSAIVFILDEKRIKLKDVLNRSDCKLNNNLTKLTDSCYICLIN